MDKKLNDPACKKNNITIKPHDYTKENWISLNMFKPQTQLTPEQIFWKKDMDKLKVNVLVETNTPLRKMPAATVYPPNTPMHLVPRTIATKSKTLISQYVPLCV